MLKKDKDGLYYVSEKTGKIYYLHMGVAFETDGVVTDDVIYIMDSGFTEEEYARWINFHDNAEDLILNETFVNWFCGASFLTEDSKEYTKYIKKYVDEYESKKKYPFTEQGVKDFYDDSIANAFEMLTKTGRAIDIDIKVGNMEITVPDTADNYERLGAFLKECQEDTVTIKDIVEERKENIMETNQNNYNYKVDKVICNSCYSEVFLETMNLMYEKFVDGWCATEFLSWLKNTAKDFQHDTEDCNSCKDIFFAIFKDYEDIVSNIIYGTNLQCCIRTEYYVEYYKIEMTEDCSLEEIIPKTQTIEERILKTLEAYHLTNKEVLEKIEFKDLEEQIEYMKTKIKEV